MTEKIYNNEDFSEVTPGILKERDKLVVKLSKATTLKQLRAVARQLMFLCRNVDREAA